MKIALGAALFLTAITAHAAFIHPMDFDNSAVQQQEVINYIQTNVAADYCDGAVDMCQPTTLRMMEKTNLKAFKHLTQATDRKLLDKVISDYCDGGPDSCSYSTINMMYNQNLKVRNTSLSW